MKLTSKLQLKVITVLFLMLLTAGCFTNRRVNSTNSQGAAVACAECRSVLLGPFPSGGDWRDENPATVTRHECPGCRGVLTSTADEYTLRHECSVCKETPFSCQVAQPK